MKTFKELQTGDIFYSVVRSRIDNINVRSIEHTPEYTDIIGNFNFEYRFPNDASSYTECRAIYYTTFQEAIENVRKSLLYIED